MKNEIMTNEWKLFEKGKDYNNRIAYKSTSDKNERFYVGDQWYGVKANNLPTPVFNVFKRITDHLISYILSSPLKAVYSSVNSEVAAALTKHIGMKWENDRLDSKLRDLLLDAALTGDMAAHIFWEPSIDVTNGIKGDFVTECVDGINVYFGNVNDREVQNQPYILVVGRTMTEYLRKEARTNGLTTTQIEKITSDSDNEEQLGDRASIELDGKTTFLIKYWRDLGDGKIHFTKSTKNVVIREDVNTGLTLYPVAFGNWTKRKNSYHGQALGTGLIPNQIFINKIFAMAMKHMMDTAFPKAVYDKTRVSGWNNAVGSAIGVNGDITGVARFLEPAGMDNGVISLIDRAMQYTTESMGANDAMLGQNIRPDNTSAIVALQQSAAIPLESIRQNLHQFIEDMARIWLDFIIAKYNVSRTVIVEGENGLAEIALNPHDLKDLRCSVRVDVGASSYWSELTSTRTLDNLLASGKIDIVQYLKRLPEGYIPRVRELINEMEQTIVKS